MSSLTEYETLYRLNDRGVVTGDVLGRGRQARHEQWDYRLLSRRSLSNERGKQMEKVCCLTREPWRRAKQMQSMAHVAVPEVGLPTTHERKRSWGRRLWAIRLAV